MSGLFKMNKKEIIRDKKFEIRMSDEEKELFMNFAKKTGINASRLARNILLSEAESTANNYATVPAVKAYMKYLEITNQKSAIERLKED